MAFSNTSVLSTVPARWTLVDATMTSDQIIISPGGSATINVNAYELDGLKDKMLFRLMATPYTHNKGLIESYVRIKATSVTGLIYNTVIPINDFGRGATETELNYKAEEYTSFVVNIQSVAGITINSWGIYIEEAGDYGSVIEGVKREIPVLLSDYNYTQIPVTINEMSIGNIAAMLGKATELQGHLQVRGIATEAAYLIVRIFDNDIQELFTPLTFEIQRGYNSISVPHAYLDKRAAGLHNFKVTAQTTRGLFTVDTRGVLYTIDSGFIADYTTDVGFNISDVTIEHPATSYNPTFIWAVGVDNGIANIRKRVFGDSQAVIWATEFNIPDIKTARIEFDGTWKLVDERQSFRLGTYDAPNVVYITTQNELYNQIGNDYDNRFLIDTEVTSTYICRGWKSNSMKDKDQGLMVAYIKNGVPYIRSYCSDALGKFLWEPSYIIGNNITDAIGITINRLNDYRIVVSIQRVSDQIEILYSPRQYVDQSLATEYLSIDANAKMAYTVNPIDYTYRDYNNNETDSLVLLPYNSNALGLVNCATTTDIKSVIPISVLEYMRVTEELMSFTFSRDIVGSDYLIHCILLEGAKITGCSVSNNTLFISNTFLALSSTITVTVISTPNLVFTDTVGTVGTVGIDKLKVNGGIVTKINESIVICPNPIIACSSVALEVIETNDEFTNSLNATITGSAMYTLVAIDTIDVPV